MLRVTRRLQLGRLTNLAARNPSVRINIPMVLAQHLSVSSDPNKPPESNSLAPKDPTASPVSATASPAKSTAWDSVKGALVSVKEMVMNPKATWITIKEVAHHYWVGSKLLWAEMKVAYDITGRVVQGHGITRRERMQLIRTTGDIFRLVPFAVFVIVPFMEFLLPFALKLFPNMLPSTFQDSLKKEEAMKHELQMRLSVAKFMQETLQEMANKKELGKEGDTSGAKEVIAFVEKARLGEAIPNDTVIRIAQLFKDELTLANVARPQLVSMCRYMNLNTYGADAILRFQLRTKFKGIKEDDRRILWEGVDALNTQELRDACAERGMRSFGLTHNRLRRQLEEWLQLSVQKNIPIALLIMSRAFALTSHTHDTESVLKSSLSSLDSATVNEVVLAVAKGGEENTVDIKQRKLDSLQFQKEMIEDEREDTEEALSKAKAAETAAATSAANTAAANAAAAASPLAQLVNSTHGIAAHVAPAEGLGVPGFIATGSAEVHEIYGSLPPGASVFAPSAIPTGTAVPPASVVPPSAVGAPAPVTPETVAAVSSGDSTPAPKSDKPKKKALTISELQALSDMARGSSVLREKAELAILQANVEFTDPEPTTQSVPAVDDLGQQETESGPKLTKSALQAFLSRFDISLPKKGQDKEVDRSLVRMRAGVKSMLDNLKVKIDSTEKALGDTLNILDKDSDGELSSEELKDAISKILRNSSLTEAEELIAALDSDKDGRVSLVELLAYIQKKTEASEVEALEAQILQAAASSHQTGNESGDAPKNEKAGDRVINGASDGDNETK